ncbi:MAG: histidine triad nucleotide-binding protein [Desulfosudaceae bacterium]
MEECIFCKIAAGEIPGDKVYEDDHYVAFNDINPQAPTHILIIPRRHIPAVADMKEADCGLLGGLFRVAAEICDAQGVTDYRLVINNGEGVGQTVFHLHLHVLAGRSFGWPPG